MTEKEYFAALLRKGTDPSLVMAEIRLREVVNGSPGSILQVYANDLRLILLEYRRLAAQEVLGLTS